MPSRVLDESGLVTKPVVAVLAHAMEMGLVLAVITAGETTILIEPVSKQNVNSLRACLKSLDVPLTRVVVENP